MLKVKLFKKFLEQKRWYFTIVEQEQKLANLSEYLLMIGKFDVFPIPKKLCAMLHVKLGKARII